MDGWLMVTHVERHVPGEAVVGGLAQLPPLTYFSPVPLMIGAVFFNANELFHRNIMK
jgi:hypothetical protein